MNENNQAIENKGYKQKNVRQINTRTILNYFLRCEELSVRDLAEWTDLSKTSVNKIISALLQNGVIAPAGKGSSTFSGGKKPELFSINPSHSYCISIYFSSVYCEARLIDLRLTTRHSASFSCQEPMSNSQIIDKLVELIGELIDISTVSQQSVFAIALLCKGITDSSHRKLLIPSQRAREHEEFDIVVQLQKKLKLEIPIYLDNIDRFGGYYELLSDEQRLRKNLLIIYTNENAVGGCIINHGQMQYGAFGLVGEVGHVTTDCSSHVRCSCGNTGCFEAMISRKVVFKDVDDHLYEFPESILSLSVQNGTLSFFDVFKAADAGDALARFVLDKVARNFSILICNARLFCDPDEIIIENLYANSGVYFKQKLQDELSANPFYSLYMQTKITYSTCDTMLVMHKGATLFCIDSFLGNSLSV